MYGLLADLVLLLHAGVVLFILGGLLLVIAGGLRGWRWVRNPLFRWLHLAMIGVVVAQAWLGRLCPLTDLEMLLRQRAGEAVYGGGFVAHWLQALIYYEAPLWVFALLYTAFALVVLACWWWLPPRRAS